MERLPNSFLPQGIFCQILQPVPSGRASGPRPGKRKKHGGTLFHRALVEGVDTLDATFVASILHPKEKVLEEYILTATIDT